MSIDPELLEILACPRCHSTLVPEQAADEPTALVCTNTHDAQCGLRFPIRDGIPILLIDEAGSSNRGSSGSDE